MEVEKLIRDGQVAVIVSPGFGAGWSTWTRPELAFDKDIALALLGESSESAENIAERKYGGDPDYHYTGGIYGAVVEWVPVGTFFRIDEYDGSETLRVLGPEDYLQA